MEKDISITVYLEKVEKYQTPLMNKSEAKEWIKSKLKKTDVYTVYNHRTNEDISYNFLNS